MIMKKLSVAEYNKRRKETERIRKIIRLFIFNIPLILWCVLVVALCWKDFNKGIFLSAASAVFVVPILLFTNWITKQDQWN